MSNSNKSPKTPWQVRDDVIIFLEDRAVNNSGVVPRKNINAAETNQIHLMHQEKLLNLDSHTHDDSMFVVALGPDLLARCAMLRAKRAQRNAKIPELKADTWNCITRHNYDDKNGVEPSE